MKVISLDIETTGLNPNKHQVLQLGAVAFDPFADKFEVIDAFSANVLWTTDLIGQPTALVLNSKIIAEIPEKIKLRKKVEKLLLDNNCEAEMNEFIKHAIPGMYVNDELTSLVEQIGWDCYPEELSDRFETWIMTNDLYNRDDNDGKKHLVIAGKNVQGFDMQFLYNLPNWKVYPQRRSFDPAELYVSPNDITLPDLLTCKDRAMQIISNDNKLSLPHDFLKKEVDHTGLEDSMDVAKLVWLYYNY